MAPNCFCIKDGNNFRDIKNNQILSIEQNNNELSVFSKLSSPKNILNHSFYSDCCFETDQTSNMRSSDPPYDNNNKIYVDYSCGKFIDNYYYFQSLPRHGNNIHNTCGSTAAQLLLSYHNYYTDRRIIDAEYLNTNNPYNCNDPLDYSSYVLGTNDDYYEYVIGKIEPGALNCHHDLNNTCCTHNGSTYLQIRNGLTSIFNDSSCIGFSVSADTSSLSPVSSNIITDEIDNNRPIIINLNSGALHHWAVAYGYQNYSYPNGGDTYFGYVAHFGWSNGFNQFNERIWVNSSWCHGYVKVQSTHTHNYVNNSTIDGEMVCSECGHKNVRFLYETTTYNTQRITGVHEDVDNIYYCPVHIPTIIDGKYVMEIDSSFRNDCKSGWRNIILPGTITSIGDEAFTGCTTLENIEIVSSTNLTSFPDQTLSYSNYYYTEHCLNVNLEPDTVYTLSFNYTSLTSTGDLTDVFTSLGVGENSFTTDLPFVKHFSGTSGELAMSFIPTFTQLSTSKKLWCRFIRTSTPQTVSVRIENVVLEKGVRDIAIDAFRGCQYLASNGLQYEAIPSNSNNLSVSQGTMSSCVLFIPKRMSNSQKVITAISPSGFANNNNIKWVFMQEGLTTIGDRAFQFCSNLLKIDMMLTSLETIDEYTFDVCAVNSDPNHVHNPHSLLYGHCMIEEITLPSTLRYIEEGAFIRTGLPTACQLPNSVETIGDYAFYSSIRLAIKLPNSLTSIGDYAFAECESLMVTNVDTGVLSIGSHAFYNTELPTLTHLSASVQTIGASAFEYSEFSSDFALVANNNLTTVGESAFAHTNLKRIVLSTSVTTVGSNAFNSCTSLTIYTGHSVGPTGWANTWNSSNRPVFWGCSISGDKTYVINIVVFTISIF